MIQEGEEILFYISIFSDFSAILKLKPIHQPSSKTKNVAAIFFLKSKASRLNFKLILFTNWL